MRAISCFGGARSTIHLPSMFSAISISRRATLPVDVDQRQALDLAVGFAQPLDQVADDEHRQLEVVLEASVKPALERRSISQGSSVSTLAERGRSSSRPISPKNSLRPITERITSCPSSSGIRTFTRPERMM